MQINYEEYVLKLYKSDYIIGHYKINEITGEIYV